ncbi:glycosyltransferase family 4 protein [Parabacteroides sp. BX2]|jgi:glycosyltransferase involved in cell wall biosynthesis|uniref:Glycosyltransferase family 4 protein n=1 Tax=Parabacteroides segnis TaxID=2763058 RepID=A0ABR7E7P5_9BACT|nr:MULTISPECIES: glycosyltransferase [Parabacteroides]MBC5645780.1 glycosyltransferase family 4 protein [Parabacteroides segnis]MCM0715564.1 glycosyltransferase family 4 protein [Parabacteroides sp. TA-V-105]
MKVLVACDEYSYRFGKDFYLRDFGQILVKRYLMVFDEVRFVVRTREVFALEELKIYKYIVEDPRVEVVPVPFFQGPLQYAKVYFSVKRMMEKVAEGCDLVILRLPSTTAFAVWDSIKSCFPYAIEGVADCYDIYQNSSSLLHKILWYRMHCKMLEASHKAMGISCVTRNYMQKHYSSHRKDRIFSHYSSIEMLAAFRSGNRHYLQKKPWGLIHVSNQVFLYSGKGHREMILILRILRERGVDVTLTFVGGDYFGGIAQLTQYAKSLGVGDLLRFSGFVSTDRLRELLLEADILVYPTRAEGLPRVIIEASALGLPCVTTPVSGNTELIDKDFLVDYSDVRGFADKIEILINDKYLYENQSRINYERSAAYCKDVLDSRRKEFYESLKDAVNNDIVLT